MTADGGHAESRTFLVYIKKKLEVVFCSPHPVRVSSLTLSLLIF